jgi:hypothetical protein
VAEPRQQLVVPVVVAKITPILEAALLPKVMREGGVFRGVLATSGPVVEAVVQAQLALLPDTRAGVRLVVQVVLESPTALRGHLCVTPAVAVVVTRLLQVISARLLVEVVAPPWWVAQVHTAKTQLREQ